MALADTAALVATLELKDQFSGPARKAEGALGRLETRTSRFGRIGNEASRGAQAAANNLARVGVLVGGVIAASVTAGIRSLQELENVTAQTNAVLESTQGVAGITGTEVRNLAEEYESLNATMDDKVIQSAENLLLTFTGIREEAFEPALQAALDMNQAMGGGEEGLQNTIIQVGKALNDPVRGATALRRVGVQLTEQQQKQIKTLVEQNDLYGAQQVILEELGKEFGGSFAAAGDTATGKMAKFRDAVEETQMNLATAFLPLMEKVADRASEFLADPEVQRRVKEFGEGLAEGLEQVIDFAGKLPWEAIGDAFSLAGQGAKAVLDAFTSLPDWLQTAVLTGWGLNKLTGGALGNIVGELPRLAFDVFKNRGTTPANPLFVKEVGIPGVGGRGAPLPPGAPPPGLLAPGLGTAAVGVALPFAMFNVIPEAFKVEGANITRAIRETAEGEQVVALNPTATAMFQGLMPSFSTALEDAGGRLEAVYADGTSIIDQALDDVRHETRGLKDPVAALAEKERQVKETVASGSAAMQRRLDAARIATDTVASSVRGTAANTATQLERIRSVESATAGNTARIAAKDFSPSFTSNVSVNLQAQISAYGISRALQVATSATQTSFSGRGGDSRF